MDGTTLAVVSTPYTFYSTNTAPRDLASKVQQKTSEGLESRRLLTRPASLAQAMDPTPFLEGRRVVASASVTLALEAVLTYNNDVLGADVISEIVRKPLMELPARERQLGSVHVLMANPEHATAPDGDCFFLVEVEGVAEGADLWIKGEFLWKLRNSYEVEPPDAPAEPSVPLPVSWLRGNGRLASFLVPYTRFFFGR